MDLLHAANWLKERRWWVALVLVVIAGYTIGKDMALRDNSRAAATHSGSVGHA